MINQNQECHNQLPMIQHKCKKVSLPFNFFVDALNLRCHCVAKKPLIINSSVFVLQTVNMAEGHDGFAKRGVIQPPCTPLSSRRCSYTHPGESPLQFHLRNRHTEQDEDEDSEDCHPTTESNEPVSSRFYEELFCTRETPMPLAPLAGALMASSGPQSDVVKEGYVGKLERSHRRYFVLRTGSHTGPSRLEWYKNQEKFTAMEKSAGKAALFGANKQGLVGLT